jgi:hypothetical protein
VSTIEELLGRKSSGCSLDSLKYGRSDPSCCLHVTPLKAKVGTNFADKRRSLEETISVVYMIKGNRVGLNEKGDEINIQRTLQNMAHMRSNAEYQYKSWPLAIRV